MSSSVYNAAQTRSDSWPCFIRVLSYITYLTALLFEAAANMFIANWFHRAEYSCYIYMAASGAMGT